MNKLSVDNLEVSGKRVLVRVDFNVPLDDGRVTDDTRIQAALPTIRLLLERGARVILMSHLGRPKGTPKPDLSLGPVAARLAELLGQPVGMAPDCIGAEVEAEAQALENGGVLLLENLRFHPGEEANDPAFVEALARLGQVYVNDAFGTAHRAHASTVGVAERLQPAASGLLMERELRVLGELVAEPRSPFVAILGGAKISGKIDVIQNLLPKVDCLMIGGGMMFTFLKARGQEIGKSLVEDERVDLARELLAEAGDKLVLPVDCRVARSVEAREKPAVVPVDQIPADHVGVDVGPRTVDAFARRLEGAGTVFWNGPLGIFEVEVFATGTVEIAKRVAAATKGGATTIIGGGDSVAAIRAAGMAASVSHLSTGGGATLEFLEGKELPGVAVLADAASVRA